MPCEQQVSSSVNVLMKAQRQHREGHQAAADGGPKMALRADASRRSSDQESKATYGHTVQHPAWWQTQAQRSMGILASSPYTPINTRLQSSLRGHSCSKQALSHPALLAPQQRRSTEIEAQLNVWHILTLCMCTNRYAARSTCMQSQFPAASDIITYASEYNCLHPQTCMRVLKSTQSPHMSSIIPSHAVSSNNLNELLPPSQHGLIECAAQVPTKCTQAAPEAGHADANGSGALEVQHSQLLGCRPVGLLPCSRPHLACLEQLLHLVMHCHHQPSMHHPTTIFLPGLSSRWMPALVLQR